MHSVHRQTDFCYSSALNICFLRTKDTWFQVGYFFFFYGVSQLHTSSHTVCIHLHACTGWPVVSQICEDSPECTMEVQNHNMPQTTSAPPHPLPAFTSGLLKMISTHRGRALAFAFYWKYRDLERRIYQL